jgi:hypothetical protein
VGERGAGDATDQQRLQRALAGRAQRNQVGVPRVRQFQQLRARLTVQQGGFCRDAVRLEVLLRVG